MAEDSPPKHQPPDELISELLPDEEESIKDAGSVGAAAAINESQPDIEAKHITADHD